VPMRKLHLARLGVSTPPTVGALAYLVLIPLLVIAYLSLGGEAGANFEPSMDAYRSIAGSPTLVQSVVNTVLFAVPATLGSVALGTWLAWVGERSSRRARLSIRALVLLPAAMPSILTTTAWTMMLSPRIGLVNRLVDRFGFPTPLVDAYSLPAMIWVEATDGLALPFLLALVAIRAVPPAALEAAAIAGSPDRRITRTIVLPLLAPALAAATLLVFVRTVGSFAVPAAMGLPGGIRVLATEVFLLARQYPPRFDLAAAYALLQLGAAIVALQGYRVMTSRADRFRKLLGREPERRREPTARPGEVIAAHVTLALVTVLPAAVAVFIAIAPRFGIAPLTGLHDLGLDAFRTALDSSIVRRAAVNTVVMGGWAALLTTGFGLATATVALRGPRRIGAAVDALATAPLAIPGNVLGLALLWWYLYLPDVGLYASRGAIIVAYTTAFLPFAHRSVHAALVSLDRSAMEASDMSGARRSRTMRRVVVPLVAPGLMVGAILVAVRATKAIAIPALLSGPGTEVLPLLVYERFVDARYAEAGAIGILTTAITLLALALAFALRRLIKSTSMDVRSLSVAGGG
jgi:iron(III) transport system permease protein